jgi:hypothetical protein
LLAALAGRIYDHASQQNAFPLGRCQGGLIAYKDGLWFPGFRRFLAWARERSLARRFEKRIGGQGAEKHRGAPETYQAIILCVGAIWLTAVRSGPEYLQVGALRYLGIALIGYVALELFVFCLYWIFVSDPVASLRRSLAMFFVNIFELSILFAIASQLMGCLPRRSPWESFYDHLSGVFRLSLVGIDAGGACKAAGHIELIVAVALMTIVIAGAIGASIPSEKPGTDSGAAAT